jgi:biopolymer transport protein ExbD
MARNRRDDENETNELDLAPIMNLVIILIPMLLLSVVFIQIGVINVTAPKLSLSNQSKPQDDKQPLNLTVSISPKGFYVAAESAKLSPISGCPTPGPTICLKSDAKVKDVKAKYEEARRLIEQGKKGQGNDALDAALAAYNWRELYNRLMKIKKKFPEETVIKIAADPDIPYAAVTRVTDVARFKLKKDSYSKDSAFWTAEYRKKGKERELLFSDPALTLQK